MILRYVGMLLLCLPFCGSAQTVYKCKGVDGKSVYQSFPCAGNVAPEKVWSGSYRQPTNAELWATYNRDQAWRANRQRDRQRAYVMSPSRPAPAESARRASCSIARSEYERVQADFTLNRNIKLLRNLEADIRRHCEVRP